MSSPTQSPQKRYAVTPVAVGAFLVGIATIAVVLRFISRKLSKAGFWWDDWLALAAWPFSVAISLSFLVDAFHGFGQHGGDPTFFLHTLYFDQIWYSLAIGLTKFSVLCFYYRIFAVNLAFRRALWITAGFVAAWTITFATVAALNCVPVRAYWHPEIEHAFCVDKFGYFIGNGIPNILLDFVLLILPVRPLWDLHLSRPHKLTLLFVFVLGYLNPLISVLRIITFFQMGKDTSQDINRIFVSPALWSATEIAMSLFSCSIPSLSYLFRKVLGQPRLAYNENSSTPRVSSSGGWSGKAKPRVHVEEGRCMTGKDGSSGSLESASGSDSTSTPASSAIADRNNGMQGAGLDGSYATRSIYVQRKFELLNDYEYILERLVDLQANALVFDKLTGLRRMLESLDGS